VTFNKTGYQVRLFPWQPSIRDKLTAVESKKWVDRLFEF